MGDKQTPLTVHIIDDETCIQRSLARLMRSVGIEVHTYSSADEFLAASLEAGPACVLADIHMQGASPLGLPDALRERHLSLPVIFLSATDNARTRSETRAAGASAFFRKPVDDQALLDAIFWAVSEQRPVRH